MSRRMKSLDVVDGARDQDANQRASRRDLRDTADALMRKEQSAKLKGRILGHDALRTATTLSP